MTAPPHPARGPARWLGGRDGVLREHDFRHLWAADVISQLGTRFSFLALPLLAVNYLHATTIEVSLLRTAQTIAFLLLGLQAGAWCDRMRRGPVVVATDLGRAALLAWVPVAAALHVLTVGQLYLVTGLAGVLSVFFSVARQSYVPHVLAGTRLVAANTMLAANQSVSAVAAPALAGLVVQWLGAPAAIAVDAASYLWSGLWLRGIRRREPAPAPPPRRHLAGEIQAGLRLVFGHPILRAFAAHSACMSLCQSAATAIDIVFLVRVVHLSAGVIGLLGTLGLLGAIAATALTGRFVRRLGEARLIWVIGIVGGAGFLLNPLVHPGWRLAFQVAATFLSSVAIIVLNIVETSYQQTICPPALLGRMNATASFLVWGLIPLGSLLGGIAGTALGLRPTLWLAGAGALASAGWLVCSPLRRLRDLPAQPLADPPAPDPPLPDPPLPDQHDG